MHTIIVSGFVGPNADTRAAHVQSGRSQIVITLTSLPTAPDCTAKYRLSLLLILFTGFVTINQTNDAFESLESDI